MQLLTGPPGSGKSHHVLERMRHDMRSSTGKARLITPTATMAEHARNLLAREGFLVRPSRILTLSRFIEPWVRDLPGVSQSTLRLMLGEALDRLAPRSLTRVSALPGFRLALAGLIEEISSAGCDARRFVEILRRSGLDTPVATACSAVYSALEGQLRERNLGLRCDRLHRAAERIAEAGLPGVDEVLLDGFFSLAAPELGLLDALSKHARVVVTLPDWPGAAATRGALLERGFEEIACGPGRRQPDSRIVSAPSREREVAEIARRILDLAAAGRAFRDIGVVVRNEDAYVPLLRSTLARFGVPARFHFAPPVSRHAIAGFHLAIIDAMLSGWDHEAVRAALSCTASGIGATPDGDRLDFLLRAHLPGRGLESLASLDGGMREWVASLEPLDQWRDDRAAASVWAARARKLRALLPSPQRIEPVSRDWVELWRDRAAALEAFDSAVAETADVLGDGATLTCADFWSKVRIALEATPVRTADARREVVHVMDVYEARQWELPVVFLCGLLEGQFPRYHAPDPVFGDGPRTALRGSGLTLRTTAERQQEEECLFEHAASRATELVVWSYPSFDDKGEETLPSFSLDRFRAPVERAVAVRPALTCDRLGIPSPGIHDDELRLRLKQRHAAWKPTAVESYLQCPYQFFARYTLRLEAAPTAPEERLDRLAQGSLVHEVIAEWHRDPSRPIGPILERLFAQMCEKRRVVPGYVAELARVEMRRNLEQLVAETLLDPAAQTHVEEKVAFPLADGVAVRGRIDRFDLRPDGRLVAYDYKYSADEAIRQRARELDERRYVQGGLYLLALQHKYGREPAAFYYVGLRGKVSRRGWARPDQVRQLMEQARDLTLRAVGRISAGDIRVHPLERDLCRTCDFRDACRVRVLETSVATEAGAWS